MLNISENSIKDKVQVEDFSSYDDSKLPAANRMLAWWLAIFLFVTVIIFFLPWTQNIQMNGQVTTLRPEGRPQDVNSIISGRIENWYVREGELVKAGDTIVFLSEVKSEYFDPDLVGRTANQITAKEGSINSYQQKANALDDQIGALKQEFRFKKEQLDNKIQQSELKVESEKAAVEQAKLDYQIASFQRRRTDTLFQKGIKSLSDLEGKRLKEQETQAKLVTAENKLRESKNGLSIARLEYQNIDNEYNNKIAKAQSDKFATLSTLYDATGSLNKLQNQYANYSRRNDMYYITAPQSGYITKATKSGIGEIIKESETIVTIVPVDTELAVELYIRPMDLPLINTGQPVRLLFDGWQSFIVASGFPNISFGTYDSEVVAIDNVPSKDNKYRILVKASDPDSPFPDLLRVGAGAKGIAMMNNVPVWYEIWRQLNGFAPDFYENDIIKEEKAGFKPPVKTVVK